MARMTLTKLISELETAVSVAEDAGLEASEVEVTIVVNNSYKTFERLSFDVFANEPQIELLYR